MWYLVFFQKGEKVDLLFRKGWGGWQGGGSGVYYLLKGDQVKIKTQNQNQNQMRSTQNKNQRWSSQNQNQMRSTQFKNQNQRSKSQGGNVQ